jgi:arabinose-5-phosphate isomerase
MTGAPGSSLARLAELALDVSVEREACPLGLAPTASTTTTLAVGDALAMVLLEERGFTREHYRRLHPGGSLGERLRFSVRDLMRRGELIPQVREDVPLEAALREMTEKDGIGLTLVVGEGGRLTGILTDGDLRRILLRSGSHPTLLQSPARDHMTRSPRLIDADASAAEAVRIMEVHGITSLAVVNHRGAPEGVVHLHDILGRGRFSL